MTALTAVTTTRPPRGAAAHHPKEHTMTMQVTVTHDDPAKPTEIITVLTPTGDNGWKYTDVDGDRIAIFTSDINGTPGVYFRTDPNGCSVSVADLEALITAIRSTAERATTAVAETAE